MPGGGVAVGGGMVLQQQQQQEETEVITRKKLQELVGQISSGEVLDPEVEEVLVPSPLVLPSPILTSGSPSLLPLSPLLC